MTLIKLTYTIDVVLFHLPLRNNYFIEIKRSFNFRPHLWKFWLIMIYIVALSWPILPTSMWQVPAHK